MPNLNQDPRQRLGALVKQRRQELGLSVKRAAEMAKVDRNTWIALEAATRSLTDAKWVSVEEVLQWPSGSIQKIVEGGEGASGSNAAQIIRDTVNDSGWDAGTKQALLAIVAAKESELAELKKRHRDVHNSQTAG